MKKITRISQMRSQIKDAIDFADAIMDTQMKYVTEDFWNLLLKVILISPGSYSLLREEKGWGWGRSSISRIFYNKKAPPGAMVNYIVSSFSAVLAEAVVFRVPQAEVEEHLWTLQQAALQEVVEVIHPWSLSLIQAFRHILLMEQVEAEVAVEHL
jgi:hypothetical protein